MTAPLTPPDCDLRGLPFMPLDTTRLLDSDLFALATGDEFKAALALWCKAWQQVPAASLPNDERVLAHLSGAGSRWRKVRDMALRGFVVCDDGRLYHPVIAAKATEAMAKRASFKERSKRGNAKRWGSHKDDDGDPLAIPKGLLELPKGEGEGEGYKEEREVDAGEPASSYAFEGATIKLTEIDLARWRKAYSAIPDIEAELTSLDAWFGQNPAKAAKWFHTASGSLNRKHQDILAAGAAERAKPKEYEGPLC